MKASGVLLRVIGWLCGAVAVLFLLVAVSMLFGKDASVGGAVLTVVLFVVPPALVCRWALRRSSGGARSSSPAGGAGAFVQARPARPVEAARVADDSAGRASADRPGPGAATLEERARFGYMRGGSWIPPVPRGTPFEAWAARGGSLEIVGESYRPDAFRRLLGGMRGFRAYEGVEIRTDALLVPDAHNPFGGGRAVAVYVGGEHVGYLAQEDADEYFPALSPFADQGRLLSVPARVWGSGYGSGNARVTLIIPAPDGLVPSNGLPSEPHVVIPTGRTIQVTKESEHMDELAPYVLRGAGATNSVAATLRSINEVRAKSIYEAVEVLIDGNVVGVLSKVQADKLLPLVRHIEQRGLLPVVRAEVTGTKLKAEVVLYTATADTVDDDWIDRLGPQVTDANIDRNPEIPKRPDFDWDDEPVSSNATAGRSTAEPQGPAEEDRNA